jgi:hypothetical protein
MSFGAGADEGDAVVAQFDIGEASAGFRAARREQQAEQVVVSSPDRLQR